MSDEERDYSEEEGEEEEEVQEESDVEAAPPADEPTTPTKKEAPAEDSGPSEAELAMQRRRQQQVSSSGLDEAAVELLEANKAERDAMEEEINELRARSERRKKEREEEEKRVMEERAVEEARRKAEEEERRSKKEADERERREARAAKMAEFEKWKNPSKPNFVITKKEGGVSLTDGDDEPKENKKSREQLEAEKQAILNQRIQKLEIDGFDEAKLVEKAKELHKLIFRLEGEKYDLEKRYKEQQYDMMELAERARQMNKVGKGGLKRVMLGADERDAMQERFAGAPAKIEMYSTFERKKDKRDYATRRKLYTGPQYRYPADKIAPYRQVTWNDQGLLEYQLKEGCTAPPEAEPEEEEGGEQEVAAEE